MKSTARAPVVRFQQWLLNPPVNGPGAIAILRLMAGAVFLSEGVMKFVFSNQGVGRFAKLGFPAPLFTSSFVGGLEIVGGCLLIAGLLTRLIAIPFVIEMVVAILSTKISLFLGTSPLAPPPAPPRIGIWAVLHESRADWAQLLTSLYLVIVGPGIWSVDALFRRRRGQRAVAQSPAPETSEVARRDHRGASVHEPA
jgi:putative oxidoreductase